MLKIVGLFSFALILIFAHNEIPAFGTHMVQQGASPEVSDIFTISTEAMNDSTILISGHAPRTAMEPVTIKVTSPNGNLIGIDQLTVDSDFNYMTKIKIGELWKVNGAYTITAYQGPPSTTSYSNTIGVSTLNNAVSTKIEVFNGKLASFNLNYHIEGGYVSNIQVDPQSNSLIITIDTQIYFDDLEIASGVMKGGILTIELPREIIDAKILDGGHDDKFVVKIDGVDTKFEETIGSSIRTLTIPFPNGSEEIMITGTYLNPESGLAIIPEFGVFAPLVLLTSITAIVIISLKSKFGILYSKQ
jgi:hypothetical protein